MDPFGYSPDQYAAAAAWASVVVLVVTGVLIYRQVAEAQRLRQEQSRPHVVVDLVPSTATRLIELWVRNIGATSAYNVKITTDPPLESSWDRRGEGYALGDTVLMREGIETLPPGRDVHALFDNYVDRDNTDLPMRYDATVAYTNDAGKTWQDRYVLDLEVFKGLTFVLRKDEHDTAKALERVAATLNTWTQSNTGVRVFSQDYDRFAWRNGYLIAHPNLALRWAQAALKRITRVDLHPDARRRREREKKRQQ